MTTGGNADVEWSKKKMEGEDGMRTVECLRGRLLAERAASRNAKAEAEEMGNKLIELENRLKEEAKSRNWAEKKLRFLMKKLESMNIPYVFGESENSTLLSETQSETSTASSSSSSSSSGTKEKDSQTTKFGTHQEPDSCSHSEYSKEDDLRIKKSSIEESKNADDDGGGVGVGEIGWDGDSSDEHVADNSLALVLVVDQPNKEEEEEAQTSIDPATLDAIVKDVLGSLSQAKENLRSSMDSSRHMIKVGSI